MSEFERRLVLLRHAKSAWPVGVDDLQRPLADRGIADATAAGPVLAGLGTPGAVLCSPARRTQETWQLVGQAFVPAPPLQIVPELYGADPDELIDLVRMIPDTVVLAVVVGHEPTMSKTATELAGPGSDPAELARLEQKYPTCAIAVLDLPAPWQALSPATAALTHFITPRQ